MVEKTIFLFKQDKQDMEDKIYWKPDNQLIFHYLPSGEETRMNDRKYHVVVLAHSKYQRIGLEASLLAMNNMVVISAETCETASRILAIEHPDLLLINPYLLDNQRIRELCECFFSKEKNRVFLVTDPYDEKIHAEDFGLQQVIIYETFSQFKTLILEKIC